MERINVSRFKQQCLDLLDNLAPDGIVITRHGKPVAGLTPMTSDRASLIGSMKGRITIKGDILSAGVRWDAES